MALQTLQSIGAFFSLWERFHPEYTEEESTEFLRELVKASDDPECKQLIEKLEKTKEKEKKMKTETDLLQEYADEMGIGDLTLSELIKSHRSLRELGTSLSDVRQKVVSEGYEYGMELGRNYAMEHKWISREDLKSMSLTELVGKLIEE